MEFIKVLIVDDEYPARMELRYHLDKYKDIKIIGEASNAEEAYQLICALDYDVIFLDIRMPEMDGLELARRLRSLAKSPKVVFVTAYEEHAIEPFGVKAFDYLLKPIDEERLQETVELLRQEIFAQEHKHNNQKKYLQIVPGEKNEATFPIHVHDIFYIYSENENIFIRTYDQKFLTRFTLRDLENRLNPSQFFRPHRCYLINIEKVKEIRPGFHGNYYLIMKDKEQSEIPVSRSNVRKLKSIFHLL